MFTFVALAEQRIQEALERGELSDLPGSGEPLDLTEDPLVPEEQRMANRILKNAGFVPPEVGLRREVAELRSQLELLDEGERDRAWKRLFLLMTRLSLLRGEAVNLSLESVYWEQLKQRMAGPVPE